MELLGNKERIESLDILRGIAILGIFFVNVPQMFGMESPISSRAYYGVDAVVRLLYDLLIQTKFYTIFAFLFGVGFYLFMSRAEMQNKPIYRLFSRRLIILLIIGMIHLVLLWRGDILHLYAVQGFWLLLFYRKSPKTILIWSLPLIGLFTLLMLISFYPTMENTTALLPIGPEYNALHHFTDAIYDRIIFFIKYLLPSLVNYTPEILGLFLLGLYCGKIRLFERVDELQKKLKNLWWITLCLSVLFSIPIIAYYVSHKFYDSKKMYFFIYLGGKSLALFYVLSLLLLLRKIKWQKRLRFFSYVGRMALTNYLLQTVVSVIIVPLIIKNTAAYSLWATAVYCLLVYLLQIGFSRWWLKSFAWGPVEWLWRAGTYGKLPAIRRKTAPGS